MIEDKLEKVPDDDPERCTSYFDMGQCQFRSVPGTTKCSMHGGQFEIQRIEKKNIRAYRLARWQSQFDRFSNDPKIKTLREEIALARLTLEAIINKCNDEHDLLVYSGKIQLMLGQIGKLVVDCNRLENHLGLVLDKSAIINLAEKIVAIISAHIPEDQLNLIAEQIAEAINLAGTVKGESL
jgi:hypothetical protein